MGASNQSYGGLGNGQADHRTLHKAGFAAGNKKGAHWRPISNPVGVSLDLFRLGLWLFLFQAIFVIADKRAELWIVVLLAV